VFLQATAFSDRATLFSQSQSTTSVEEALHIAHVRRSGVRVASHGHVCARIGAHDLPPSTTACTTGRARCTPMILHVRQRLLRRQRQLTRISAVSHRHKVRWFGKLLQDFSQADVAAQPENSSSVASFKKKQARLLCILAIANADAGSLSSISQSPRRAPQCAPRSQGYNSRAKNSWP